MRSITEDDWHRHSGSVTASIVCEFLEDGRRQDLRSPARLLNAGAGAYELRIAGWEEFPLDLFISPIRNLPNAVCGSIEALPFVDGAFSAVVCVGEVLGYCDPAIAIKEFRRVLAPGGVLICDFASSRSARHWLTKCYGRAADLVTDQYNGTPERIWVYDPAYIQGLIAHFGMRIRAVLETHRWSALCRRLGVVSANAVRIERVLGFLSIPRGFGDIMTIVAERP